MKRVLFVFVFIVGSIVSFSRSKAVIPTDGAGLVFKKNEGQLIDIFKAFDLKVLQSNNEKEISQYLKEKNQEIIKYLAGRYPQFGSIDTVDVNDPETLLFGLTYAVAEANNFQPIKEFAAEQHKIPTWLRCVVDVTLGYFDIQGIINGLGSFEFGTVWKVVKSSIKKYVGWLGAAILIYDIVTECL